MIPSQPDRPSYDELIVSWKKTTSLLQKAKLELPATRLKEYEECLSHNELELALDQLEEIGMEATMSDNFWQLLVPQLKTCRCLHAQAVLETT